MRTHPSTVSYRLIMREELDQLAERIRQLTLLTQQLRQENKDLRLQNHILEQKITVAGTRVQSILERLPAVDTAATATALNGGA